MSKEQERLLENRNLNRNKTAQLNRIFRVCFVTVILLFAVAYSLASILPHILYRTYALDLGMFNHALYNYAHLQPAYFTLSTNGTEVPYLGDHFSPLTMLYAPFYYLFGSYTLLIIQIIAILFGGYSVFEYARFKGINRWLSMVVMIHFFILWAVFGALSFDFHNNVVAAMLVPWFVLQYEKGNLKSALIFFALILMAKENMALWMSFILLGLLMLQKNKFTIKINVTLGLIAFSFIYFLVVVLLVMPAYSKGIATDQLARYEILNGSFIDIIKSIFLTPQKYFAVLFEDTRLIGHTGVKSALWFIFLISGGFTLFYKPQYLVMIIPVIAQKMLSSSPVVWSSVYHYSIELAPVISFGVIAFLARINSGKWKIIFLALLIFTSYYYNKDDKGKSRIPLFRAEHYKTDLNISEINKALNQIPDNAIISVNSQLAPHLANRDIIRIFPYIKGSEYIVLLKQGIAYPMQAEEFQKMIDQMLTDTAYIVYNSPDLLISKVQGKEFIFQTIKFDPVKLKEIEDYIRNSTDWYNLIKEKAKINNLPVDTMLKRDAKYVYEKKYN